MSKVLNKLNITECYKLEKLLCYHLYNMQQVKSFQNDLPIFYAIYNISAMKMHQLHNKIGGSLVGVFTDTIIVEGNINAFFMVKQEQRKINQQAK